MRNLGAVQPNGIGVIDLQGEHFGCGREPAEDGIGGRRLTRIGEGGTSNGVAGCEGKLDRVARGRGERIWSENKPIFANGNLVNI
jgi:hypothetical protein